MSTRIAGALVALAAALGAAAPAHAAFTLANPAASPADVAAGAHSDVRIHVEPQGGQIRDLDLHLPKGLIGDPQATPRCPTAEFERNACPASTQVGRSSTTVQIGLLSQTANGQIFNIAPRGKEPARLGVKIDAPIGEPIRLESPVTSRPDGGLDSTLRDLPREVAGLDMTITALDIVLSGQAGGKPFMTNPTGCSVAETVFDARSYANETTQAKARFTPTKCDALPFAPGFEAVLGAPGQTQRRTVAPLTTAVTQQRGEANVRSVAVTLPKELAVDITKLSRACAKDAVAAGTCPASSEVGTATAVTPLLTEPLAGPVIFAFGEATLPDLVLSLRGPLALTLRGSNAITPAGQVTTFDGIPDVPLSRFELAFAGGDRGLLSVTRDLCEGRAPRLSAKFTSQAGRTHDVTVPAKVQGCSPQIGVTLGSLQRRRPSLRLRVVAGQARVRTVRLTLPRALRVSGALRARLSGSGARGARLTRRGRVLEIRVPRAGARTVGLAIPSGALRAGQGISRRTRFAVEVTDATGERTRRTVRATG